MVIRPITLSDANAFVAQHHRHHKPVQGHRFSLSAVVNGTVVGVCIVGRPVSRGSGDPLEVLEVTRLCTNGTKNACSFLYSAAARAGKELGYLKIQTYILASEPGVTLRAVGWTLAAEVRGRQWKHTDGKPRRTDQPTENKLRWEKVLRNGD